MVVVDDGSADPDRTAEVARAAGGHVVRLAANAGPAAARNAGLAAVATPLVAMVDSDCTTEPGWWQPLVAHFADPEVAAVAPRVRPAQGGTRWWDRYDAARGPLDRGARPGTVRPGGRIPFVPTAALVVRTAALGRPCFDEDLRGGEDVDLVWRLVAAGWTVRYVPEVVVGHDGPGGWRPALARRFFYGTTAGPLARRHPGDLAPAALAAPTAAAWTLALAGQPLLGLSVVGWSVAVLAARLRTVVRHPRTEAARIAGLGSLQAGGPALGGLFRVWGPLLVAGLAWRRTRRLALLALVVPPLGDWRRSRPPLDPLRYGVAHVADDLAYGAGVWWGCLQARTLRPLLPSLVFRSSRWRRGSVGRDPGGAAGG